MHPPVPYRDTALTGQILRRNVCWTCHSASKVTNHSINPAPRGDLGILARRRGKAEIQADFSSSGTGCSRR